MSDFRRHSWTWSEVAPPPATEPRPSFRFLARVAPLLVAGLLFWLARPVLASIVLGGYAAYVILHFAAPAVPQLIGGLITQLSRWLSRIVGNVGFTLLYFLIFTPVALLSRRRDLLQLEWSRSAQSYWQVGATSDPSQLFLRPFLLERKASSGTASARQRTFRVGKAVYHTVVTLFLLNLVLGLTVRTAADGYRQYAGDPRAGSSAYATTPWARDYFDEFQQSRATIYKPFLGWTRRDYSGKYINITDGIRKTYAPGAPAGNRLRLYAFGGSTMWGTGARDDFTIPSYLVKRAQRDGIELEAVNLAETGYVNWQDTIRLAELCAQGEVPDLVLFYEGANDVVAKLQTPSLSRVHQNYSDWRERNDKAGQYQNVESWLQKNSLVHLVGRRLGNRLFGVASAAGGQDSEEVKLLADQVVATYAENARFVEELAHTYGFRVWFFWQPVVYTRNEPTDEERSFSTDFGDRLERMYVAATAEIREHDFAIDLSQALDQVPGTVYIDWAHVSEQGNELVADAIYGHLYPSLGSPTTASDTDS